MKFTTKPAASSLSQPISSLAFGVELQFYKFTNFYTSHAIQDISQSKNFAEATVGSRKSVSKMVTQIQNVEISTEPVEIKCFCFRLFLLLQHHFKDWKTSGSAQLHLIKSFLGVRCFVIGFNDEADFRFTFGNDDSWLGKKEKKIRTGTDLFHPDHSWFVFCCTCSFLKLPIRLKCICRMPSEGWSAVGRCGGLVASSDDSRLRVSGFYASRHYFFHGNLHFLRVWWDTILKWKKWAMLGSTPREFAV